MLKDEVIKRYNSSMGGVDKMDVLLGLYRIFIRSKKWTLRLFFHAIDMAICNSWLEYKEDCKRLGVDSKKILDLLHLDVGNSLGLAGTMCGKDKKRGRPSLQDVTLETNSNNTKRCRFETRPIWALQTKQL
ncbi:uncharacterized protein [Diabrotica undecimpunctata]|uniref:uncharacterized protein n=1 Tax=Diabrotica undecimpunctata TaxID=50387 RepID=UPI003B63E02D